MIETGKKQIVVLLILLPLALRLWNIAGVADRVGDEYNVLAATQNYVQHGRFAPLMWMHPPLPYILTALGLSVLGDNPYGWRLQCVIAGSLSVYLLYLLARDLFGDARPAFLAALFLAIEPIHILLSRTMSSEVIAIFFFLLAVYTTVLRVNKKIGSFWFAGVAMGMAVAERWYYLPSLAVLLLYVLVDMFRNRELTWTRFLHSCAVYLALPAGIYLLTFIPWFQRGYTLSEFAMMQIDAYRELQNITTDYFRDPFMRQLPSSPWSWFISPQIVGMQIGAEGGWARYFLIMGNPPVWLLTIPAFLYVSVRWIRERNAHLGLILALFVSTYGQFIAVRRPIFIYSALAVLPVVYLIVADFLAGLLKTARYGERRFAEVVVAVAAWGLYLYPPTVSMLLPTAVYAPLLLLAGLH